ncbi:hypothetical protein [Fibrella arboris]|uniref:hypothetical protein n=1 Tax=Fibrella arboris TaxID=3242486 RepID=UPI00351FC6DE
MTYPNVLAVALLFLITSPGWAQLGGSAPKYDERVRKVLDAIPLKYEITAKGNFKVLLRLKSNRTQLILISSTTSTFGSLDVRKVYSYGATSTDGFSASVQKKLLEYNDTIKFGGWYTTEEEGKSYAIFKVLIGADADGITLNNVVELVALAADEIELDLTSKDDY